MTESAARSRLIQTDEPMCDKCQQLESTIQHYRRLLSHFFDDPITVERVNKLIRDLQQRKEAMHC